MDRVVGARASRSQLTADLALAVALVLAGVVDTARSAQMTHPATELWVVLAMGAVALRTVAPLAMCGFAAAGFVGFALMPETGTPLWGFIGVLVLTFSAGAHLEGPRRWAGLLLLLVAAYVLQVLTSAHQDGSGLSWSDVWVTPAVLVGVPALAGWLLRRSRWQTAELRRLAAELTAERERHVLAAALAERNRIARELHDVISHSVSVMVVQAGAAENLLAADAPARSQVRAIRDTGKEALAELRRQLGLLRDGDAEPVAPMPGLSDLRGLCAAQGAELQTGTGLADVDSPGLELAAYRVVQEGLTNAHRHATERPAVVRLERCDGALELTVLDRGGGPAQPDLRGSGNGLVGIRERVALYGGRVESGPRRDGPGWRLFARFPLGDGR